MQRAPGHPHRWQLQLLVHGPVSGTARSSPYRDVITATANDDDGNTVQAQAFADVALTDVLPSIVVDKTATPLALPEPTGTFAFGVTVTSRSVEPVTLTTLTDDVYSDLDSRGDCALPQTVAAGGSYACTFTGTFTGNAGDTQTDVVTATAEDDEGNPATDDDDATVRLTDACLPSRWTRRRPPVRWRSRAGTSPSA
ncbi:MAG: hypothetical protein R3C32_10355 [Chloroflexota bacterium]